MSTILSRELRPYSRPCVGSGFCCKQAPCGFGKAAPGSPQCVYLERWEQTDTETPRYRCGKYEEIQKDPTAWFSPAFGAGCTSPLGNTAREQILVELRRKPSDNA
jgi:hypothetical protein